MLGRTDGDVLLIQQKSSPASHPRAARQRKPRVRGLLPIQQMQFFARFEANRLAGCDADLGARPRIAPDAGLARPDVEYAEPAQLDALALGERPLESLEHRVHSRFRLVTLQAGALNHLMNNVLFYQGVPPRGALSACKLSVESFSGIVNAAALP